MRYMVRSVDIWPISKTNLDKLLRDYPCLEDFGLENETIDGQFDAYINIDSIEELMRLIDKVGHGLIVYDDPPMIEIYDNYRE